MKIFECNNELDLIRQQTNKIQEKLQKLSKQQASENDEVAELRKKLDESFLENDILQEQMRGLQLSNQDLVMGIKILKEIQDSQIIRIEIQSLIEKSQFNQQQSNDYHIKEIYKQKLIASKKIEKFKMVLNDLKTQFNNFDVDIREAIFNLKKQNKLDIGEQEKLILEQKIKLKSQSDQIFALNKDLQEQKRQLDHMIEDARSECRRKLVEEFENKIKEYQKQLNDQNDYSAQKMKDLYTQLNNTKYQLQQAGKEMENLNNQNSKLRMNGQQVSVFQNQLKRTEQKLEEVEQHNKLSDRRKQKNE